MTVSYPVRLILVCLASFFLIHLMLGLLVAACSPGAIRHAGRMAARAAARFLLALRLISSVGACLVVASLVVPSFVLLEPHAGREGVGVICVAAAVLGFTICVQSICRTARTIAGSWRFEKNCLNQAEKTYFVPEDSPVWVVDAPVPLVALAGVLRPKLVVSSPVVDTLSRRELAVALRHERAHLASRDNFKRLLVSLTPDLLPLVTGFRALEREWAKFSEWAADDEAVAGRPELSLALATALVSVVRLGNTPIASPGVASLLGGTCDLAERVERLLGFGEQIVHPAKPLYWGTALAAIALSLAAAACEPALFAPVHEILERLVA